MTPRGQHPATPGSPRTTPGHPGRSIYQPEPSAFDRWMESCGLGPDPDPIAEGFEDDLQADLDRERRLLPRFPKALRLRRIDTTDNDEKRAA